MTSCNTNKQVPVSVNGLLSLNQQKHFVSDTGEHPQSRVCTGPIRNTHPQQPPGLSWIKHQCVCLCVCVWERVFTYMGVLFKYKWPALLINLITQRDLRLFFCDWSLEMCEHRDVFMGSCLEPVNQDVTCWPPNRDTLCMQMMSKAVRRLHQTDWSVCVTEWACWKGDSRRCPMPNRTNL